MYIPCFMHTIIGAPSYGITSFSSDHLTHGSIISR